MSRWVWLTGGIILGVDWLRRSVAALIGMRTLSDVTKPEWDRFPNPGAEQPRVTIVVPARNEEAEIERCLRSLLAQDYPELDICAIDDRSTDSTGTIMDRLQHESAGKLRVLHVTDLPAGWLGKTQAMWQGARTSAGDWILFTDGDIVFRPDTLRRTLSYAEAMRRDHLTIFPTIIMKTFGERMMMAFFGMASTLLVRAWKVRDPKAKDYIGAGAFNLIRRSAYEALGSYQALRMEVIDDLKLGEAVKKNGFASDVVFGPELVKLRWAKGAFGVVNNLRKNMFSLMGFSWLLAVLAAIAATVYHVGPWLGMIFAPGIAKIGFLAAILGIALMYAGMSREFQVSSWYLFTHPVAALLSVYTLMASAVSSVIHGGVVWRGTTYSIAEIQAANAQSRREQEEQRRLQVTGNRG